MRDKNKPPENKDMKQGITKIGDEKFVNKIF